MASGRLPERFDTLTAAPGGGPIPALTTKPARGPDPEGTGAPLARHTAFFRFERL